MLLVDDEPSIRAALRRFFSRRGWAVDEAPDGETALQMLVAGPGEDAGYAAVISDMRMPKLSGLALHDRLLAERPDLLRRFIFSTGDVASREAAAFVERAHCPVLQKPFELTVLAEVVERVARSAAAYARPE